MKQMCPMLSNYTFCTLLLYVKHLLNVKHVLGTFFIIILFKDEKIEVQRDKIIFLRLYNYIWSQILKSKLKITPNFLLYLYSSKIAFEIPLKKQLKTKIKKKKPLKTE